MGELDDAIREHLELKRRRGADPAEVAREEQEALAPVTRGHAIVGAEEPEPEAEDHGVDSDRGVRDEGAPQPPPNEDPGDATQEFRVADPESGDWLADDEDEHPRR